MIPPVQGHCHRRLRRESIQYHLGGTFRGTYYTLNDNIINGRIRGVAGVVGCNNARTRHNEAHIAMVKELIKNDVSC
jgi:carbon-monoxide dehydrogenase catalytic subunit